MRLFQLAKIGFELLEINEMFIIHANLNKPLNLIRCFKLYPVLSEAVSITQT